MLEKNNKKNLIWSYDGLSHSMKGSVTQICLKMAKKYEIKSLKIKSVLVRKVHKIKDLDKCAV